MIRAKEVDCELEDARAALQYAKDEIQGRNPRPTEQATLAALSSRIQGLEQEQRLEQAQLEHARGGPAPSGRLPMGNGEDPRDRGSVAADDALSAMPKMPVRSVAAIDRLFAGAPSRPSAEVRERFRASVIAALDGHPDIMAASQNEGDGVSGGFAVPVEVSREIFRRALEQSVYVRAGCRIEPMMSDEKIIPAWDDADETNDAEAAVVAHWTGEGETMTPQVARMRGVTLRAKKLSCIAACSSELFEDAPGFLPALETVLSNAIAKKFDRSVLTGGGAAEPMGLLASGATVVVAKESAPAQPAATILLPNVTKMWASLAPGLHESAVWLAHPTTLPQLLALQLKILNAAGVEYVGGSAAGFFESGGDGSYRLLSRPLYITSRVKVLGQPGDLVLFSPSETAIGIRSELQLARSQHAYFTSDEIAVRARFRGDVTPMWDKKRTLVGSGGDVGPAVVIAVRS